MIGCSAEEEENENTTVEMCIFPLIYRNNELQSDKLQPYTKATVFIHDNYNLFSLNSSSFNFKKIFSIPT